MRVYCRAGRCPYPDPPARALSEFPHHLLSCLLCLFVDQIPNKKAAGEKGCTKFHLFIQQFGIYPIRSQRVVISISYKQRNRLDCCMLAMTVVLLLLLRVQFLQLPVVTGRKQGSPGSQTNRTFFNSALQSAEKEKTCTPEYQSPLTCCWSTGKCAPISTPEVSLNACAPLPWDGCDPSTRAPFPLAASWAARSALLQDRKTEWHKAVWSYQVTIHRQGAWWPV